MTNQEIIRKVREIRKADVEAVKHFITKQEDTFRPAYARVPETFKRQCVFAASTNEQVNHPDHYNQYDVEVIDMMIAIWGRAKVEDFCRMSAFKYRMRVGHKDDIKQDLAKESWYLGKIKELKGAEDTEPLNDLLEFVDKHIEMSDKKTIKMEKITLEFLKQLLEVSTSKHMRYYHDKSTLEMLHMQSAQVDTYYLLRRGNPILDLPKSKINTECAKHTCYLRLEIYRARGGAIEWVNLHTSSVTNHFTGMAYLNKFLND